MKTSSFIYRHIGPRTEEIEQMLKELGVSSIEELIAQTVPENIRLKKELQLPAPMDEAAWLEYIRSLGQKNNRFKSFIGYGFYESHMPAVIMKNIFENPAWYTAYTPYQAEISQGRLEALLNYQTMLTELTGLDLANASLLDDATAAAEAMLMLFNLRSRKQKKSGINKFFIDKNIFPHISAVIKTRAYFKDIELIEGDVFEFEPDENYFGVMWQNPGRSGALYEDAALYKRFSESGLKTAVISDLMALTLIEPPGHKGADVVVGSTQRFGLPLYYGGPHTGFFVTKQEYKRHVPGRIIGVSVDRNGNRALRMALQTREQHIKRENATSNICTSQVLMAILNGMYAVYHGPEGLREIAKNIHRNAVNLENSLQQAGFKQLNEKYFDTLRIQVADKKRLRDIAEAQGINFNYFEEDDTVLIAMDEMTTDTDLSAILDVFSRYSGKEIALVKTKDTKLTSRREDNYMAFEVFHRYRSETELMRYIKRLENKDFSLVHGMIPLGSCTMKLNAAAELPPLSDPSWTDIHPFVPVEQAAGYGEMFENLGRMLCEITGLDAVSFQPNSGAAGEYAGLVTIKSYFERQGQNHRDVALIPASAHGTNPASAVMAGMKVVVVKTTESGNIDVEDLQAKAEEYAERLAVFIVTYPSTHGVFEKEIKRMTDIIHRHGGLVYMDGANMNAQMGLTSPGEIGADVCHLNLHKTFAVPHGGGGPGAGPILVKDFLKEFLPSHALIETGGKYGRQVASAPFGSAAVPLISYGYILMSGAEGLKMSAETAILNANYLETKLDPYFPTLYKGEKGRVAHEFIADVRPFKEKGIQVLDIAKRLMDYGFHAPTVSFPVPGTLMIEPTESESKAELDRFIESMISIYHEIEEMESEDNPLVNAPHTLEMLTADMWFHTYTRKKAAYPLDWIKTRKFWPAVARIDDAYGDRHLHCTCAPLEAYIDEEQKK